MIGWVSAWGKKAVGQRAETGVNFSGNVWNIALATTGIPCPSALFLRECLVEIELWLTGNVEL